MAQTTSKCEGKQFTITATTLILDLHILDLIEELLVWRRSATNLTVVGSYYRILLLWQVHSQLRRE